MRVENTFAGMETSVAPLSIVKLSDIVPLMTTGTCSVPRSLISGIDSEYAAPKANSIVNNAALEKWLTDSVLPLAQARFGQKVAEVDVFGAYSCRSVDNIAGAQLSEHAFGNAVDVSGFRLADGREIVIAREWKKTDTQESAFLHEAHAGACQHFTTVLGPGADVFHYNHFHLDLAMHGATNTGPRRYCKPLPAPNLLPPPAAPDGLPPAPDIEEPMDVARAKPVAPTPRFAMAPMSLHGPSVAVPPPVQDYDARPLPPILPDETGVDGTPTSTVPVSHDD